ncbi:MAG: alpha/beta hydrolase [Bryobacterales bacterium]|nr:alpha/beta hydrolase [Bryobacterales bacterium]
MMNMTTPITLLVVVGIVTAGCAACNAQDTVTGAFAEVNGIRMYYEVHGSGSPLVLLHGFASSGEAWKRFAPEFAKNHQVIVPDLRGHGRSTNPSGEFTHKQAANDVFALLESLGIGRFAAMGISAGGCALLHMAISRPDKIEALVLIGTPPYWVEQTRAIMRKYTPESMTANENTRELKRLRQIHRYGDEQIKALMRQFSSFANSYDDVNFTPPQLGTIRARTLIVQGDRDEFIPLSLAVLMRQSIRNSWLWIIPNAGHVAINSHPEEFVRIAADFLGAAPPK